MKTQVLLTSILVLSNIAGGRAASETIRFAAFGDYGTDDSRELAVSRLVKSWHPDFVVTTGDNSYSFRSVDRNVGKYYAEFIGDYNGGYGPGSIGNRFFPSAGNHDYFDGSGINAYLNYFSLPGDGIATSGTSGNELYYDFVIGPVHFFALNSNVQEVDGVTPASVQGQWLQTQLAASTSPWKIVYMHHPPYSSSTSHGSQVYMQWPYEDWGATAILTGHDHTYERIMRDDNTDNDSIPYFVTGFGGRPPYGFPSSNFVPGSAVRYNTYNGSMLIEANDSALAFYFFSAQDEGVLIDEYRIGGCCLHRGNIDGSAGGYTPIDIVDLTFLVSMMYRGGPLAECPRQSDVNSSGQTDLADLVYLVDYLFRAGPKPGDCY